MSRSPEPLFLERRNYRRRRLKDAARLLPVVGLVLFLMPLLFAPDGEGRTSTASVTIYIFAIWVLLILAAALIARVLGKPAPDTLDPRGRERAE